MLWMWIFLIFITLAIVIASIFMAPENNSFSGALVGSNDLDLFKVSKERGSKKFLKVLMWSLGFMLIIAVIIIRTA